MINPLVAKTEETPDPFVNVDPSIIPFPNKNSPLLDSLGQSTDLHPDKAADILKLSDKFQKPPDFIEANYDAAKKASDQPPQELLSAVAKQYPYASEFLTNPKNMAVAKDDIDSLAKTEDLVKNYGTLRTMWASLNVGMARTMEQVARVPATLYDIAAFPQNLLAKGMGRPDLEVSAPDNAVARFYSESAKAWTPPALDQSVTDQIKAGNIGAASKAMAAQLVESAPSLALLMVAGVGGYGGAGLAGVGLTSAASAEHRNLEMGIDPATATLNAAYHGTINAAFMNLGALSPLHKWEMALAKSVGADSARQVVLDVAKTLVGSFTSMGGSMAAISAGTDVSDFSTGVNPDALRGSWKRALDAAIVGGFTGAALVGPAAVMGGVSRADDMQRVQKAKDFYLALGDASASSKLRERLSDSHREFVERLTKDGPVENVFVPVERFDQYFQDQNIDPEQVAKELGVSDKLKEARQTGGDLSIPLSTWTDKAVGTEHFKGLADDVKFAPEDLTARQATERQEVISGLMKSEAEKAGKEDPALQKGREVVYNDVRQKLLDVGRPEKEANAAAELWASRSVVEASRRGITPETWYQGKPIEVVSGEQSGRTPGSNEFRQGPEAAALAKKALERFGETTDLRSAGFVLADGRMVDFTESGTMNKILPQEAGGIPNPSGRLYDHRSIAEIYGRREYSTDTERMRDFIGNTGAARIGNYSDVGGDHFTVETQGPLSQDQLKAIGNYLDTHPVSNAIFEIVDNGGQALRHKMISKPTGEDVGRFFNGSSTYYQSVNADKTQTPEFKNWFGESKVVDSSGEPKVVYRGDFRADLVGNILKKSKTTSGRFYFTEDPEIASKYATGKTYNESTGYDDWFKIGEGKRKADLNRAWYQLTPEQRNSLKDALSRAQYEDGQITFGEPFSGNASKDHWEHILKEQHGDWLKAGRDIFLDSGLLFDDEEKFGEILKKAGLNFEYVNPHEGRPAVTPVYLAIQNPLDASHLPEDFVKAVEDWASKSRIKPRAHGADMWDKSLRNPKDYAAELRKAFETGDNLWTTSLPEPVVSIAQKLGYDGIKDMGGKYGGVENAQWIAFEPEQVKSAIGNRGTFNPDSSNILHQGEAVPRGSVEFTPEKAVIKLFKEADASTFLHESAHVWLADMFDFVKADQASEQYKGDWKIISDWLGVTDGQAKLTRDQHEKFAKGFEAYLRDGKAPSEGLRGAFVKFRRWLTKIYRDNSQLNADLSEPVRGVMDRMLASEDEISFQRNQMGMDLAPEIPGLDPSVQAKLAKLRQEAHEQAVSQLLNKQMKELTDEHKDRLATETDRAKKAAEEEVAQLPEQKATEALTRAYEKDGRRVAQAFVDKKMSREEFVSFRMIAEMQGYSGPSEMAQKILAAKSFKEEVAARVAEKMAPFADLRNTDKIHEEALQAIHNEKQIELVANERAIFQSLVDEAQGRVQAAKMRREEARIDALAAKQKAGEIISNTSLKEAGSFMRYFTAERQAALEAQKAAAEGKFQFAADAKQKQMLNHALAQEAFRARRQIEGWKDYISATRSKDKNLFKQESHFNQVAAILERFGAGRSDFDPKTRTENLQEWNDRMVLQDEAVAVAPWLMDESLTKPFTDLTVNEAHDVVNSLKNIQRIANAQFNFYRIMGGALVQDTILDLRKEAASFNEPTEAEQIMRRRDTVLDKAKKFVRGYESSLRTIENVALKLGGWKDDSLWYKTIWDPIEKAADFESNLMKPLNENFEKLLKGHYTDQERQALVDYDEAKFIPELNQSVRKIELLMMALNTGNEGNRARLFQTPIVGMDPSLPWGEAPVMSLLQKNLNAHDWKFVQGAWDLIESLWPEEVRNHKEITGFTPSKVEPKGFYVRTADGDSVEMRGGYFPLKSDTRANLREEIREHIDDPLYTERNPAWKAVTKQGHLESRAKGARYPVALDSSIIQRHLRDAVHDVAFRATVIDLRRLIGNQQFSDMVKTYAGDEQYKALREWVGSAASGNARETTALTFWEQVSKSIRQKYTSAILMFNPKIVTQNLSNVFLYAGAVDGFDWNDVTHGFFSKGILDFIPNSLLRTKRADELRQMVYDKSPWMRDKKSSPDYSIQETFNRLVGKNKKMSDFFFGYFSAADELTSLPMWLTAYEKARALEKPEADAVAFADTVIRRSIGNARKVETAPIFRGSELDRTMATFQGFMNAQQNRWERERGILAKDYFKNAPRFAGYIGAHFVLFAAASNIMSGNLPDFSDSDKMKRWMKSLLLYRFQMLPGINAISSVVADQALGLPSFGYRPIPQATVIEKAIDTVKAGVGYVKGKTEGKDVVESLSHAAAFATGEPDQFMKIFWNVYDYWAEGMTPQLGDALGRRPKKERN